MHAASGPPLVARSTRDSENDFYRDPPSAWASRRSGGSSAAAPFSRRVSGASSLDNAIDEATPYPGALVDAAAVVRAGASQQRRSGTASAASGDYGGEQVDRPAWPRWQDAVSFTYASGIVPSTAVRTGVGAAVAGVEVVTLLLALGALGLDAWLAPEITSDRTIAGTKWAVTHATRAGLWSVCLDSGAGMLARDNPFYATRPSCSGAVAEFYRSQVYDADLWLYTILGQTVAVFFVGVTVIKLFTGFALTLADTSRGPAGLGVLRRELGYAYCAGKIAQPVLGYALLGLLIAVLKTTEERELALTQHAHNYAGPSFWIWLAATVSVALTVFISSMLPPKSDETMAVAEDDIPRKTTAG
mmetsp:Transcript_9052/g.23326  ORF Transcript_9052/g.23326 Transcript_9052/m.23326 type:complete len:359 (-) Transcript_9052:93-1169(-)|eukprot:jgi/Tetstr1/429189/TSEL_019142.t1